MPHKAVIFLILLLLNLITGYDFFNIIAVVLVGQTLCCFRNSIPLKSCCLKFDEKIGSKICSCIPGVYITAQEGDLNEKANTDDLKPFDRRKVSGTRISTSQEYINSQKDANP